MLTEVQISICRRGKGSVISLLTVGANRDICLFYRETGAVLDVSSLLGC